MVAHSKCAMRLHGRGWLAVILSSLLPTPCFLATTSQYGICSTQRPRGHFCPRGSGAPLPCPPGKMSSALGLERESQCQNCTAGYYCSNSSTIYATEPCDAGFYCEEGTVTPTLECWKGHYCAGGNRVPTPCARGSYQNITGQSICNPCPGGYFCEQAQVTPDACPAGFFCPAETTYATEFPCPNGTFNNKTRASTVADCTDCLGGKYCETSGLSWPSGYCNDGYFCGRGSNTATPDDGEVESIYVGETCADQDDIVNGVCPRGHICPSGSSSPTQCPPGKMNSAKGQFNPNHCEDCRAGYYCPHSATINATLLCEPGFFCPGGDIDPTYECTLGHYCVGGDKEPNSCAPGSYQNTTGQTECRDCPRGHFCVEGTIVPKPCPQGYYCPLGTQYATQFACPNGTFNNNTMISSVDDCEECLGGFYCEIEGLSAPTGPCAPGYFCAHGSATATPGDNGDEFYKGETCSDQSGAEVNGVCPSGHYCPEQSSAPAQCPPGTMSSARGLTNVTECAPCEAGCPDSATINATMPCDPGFTCPGGTVTSTLLCTQGHKCPGGDAVPIACASGTYNNLTGQTECRNCPPGYYCVEGTITPRPCPRGYYCPLGTQHATQFSCPNGTFNNRTTISSVDECAECIGGFYCEIEGLSAPTGPCAPGYFCAHGSATATPGDNGDEFYKGETCSDQSGAEVNGVCPSGHYCPEQSSAPVQCPPGTMSSARGLRNVTECEPCEAGYQCVQPLLSNDRLDLGSRCPDSATINATIPCDPGFTCPGGDATSTVLCTQGHYCPRGDAVPVPCEPGTYNNLTGQTECRSCPPGYYCVEGTITPRPCPQGYYCPLGTQHATQFSCPNGTFNNRTTISSVDECAECIGGFYCEIEGLSAPTGPCAPGYFCAHGSATATPGDNGDEFYKGETCSDQSGAEVNGVCPSGHYCPEQSSAPVQCPPGTMSSARGLRNVTECEPCEAGYQCVQPLLSNDRLDLGSRCPDSATINATIPCDPGFTCPGGDATSTVLCTQGHYCPGGDSVPAPCEPGTYTNTSGQTECRDCPPGYYCTEGTIVPRPCQKGYYCPLRTQRAAQFACPNGTFNNRTMISSFDECTECIGGFYCEIEGLSAPTGPCASGFYCAQGSATATPGDNDDYFYTGETCSDQSEAEVNGVCPSGHYCPEQSSAPVQCPSGTMSSARGLTNVTECEPCAAGYQCPESATINATVPCDPGFTCPGGDATSTVLCTEGHECPGGNAVPIACVPGTYTNLTGQTECSECPAGFFCVEGTIVPETCPAGYFCLTGTKYGTEYPCLPGTYSTALGLEAADDCTPCVAGSYCGSYALTAPEGPCGPGRYCLSGASTPDPDGSDTTGGPCSGGYVCVLGAKSATPNGEDSSGYPCPKGAYAPEGSAHEQGCAPGTYQPSEAQASCLICPAGYTCAGNTSLPATCPIGRYCEDGSILGEICPDGTYGHEDGLESTAQCAACPAKKYCRDGNVTGVCAAGHFCRSAASVPTPEQVVSAVQQSTYDEKIWSGFLYAQCPPSHYCPRASEEPTLCPNATWRNWTHATSLDDCEPCPAGVTFISSTTIVPNFIFLRRLQARLPARCFHTVVFVPFTTSGTCRCIPGDPVPVPCPRGYYSPLGVDPIPCPQYTYNSKLAATALHFCLSCPAGYFCQYEGTAFYHQYPCSEGHYCLEKADTEIQCPAGTYQPELSATNITDCRTCPAGHYCGVAATTPTYCVDPKNKIGYYCPAGSANKTICPAGMYCPQYPTSTGTPIECPAGSYCPQGSLAPIRCFNGTYCPSGSEIYKWCPLGYVGQADANNTLTSIADACEACAAGFYGADPARLECTECTPGYVCLGATTSETPADRISQNGYLCPSGAYCPAGSSTETLCPAGTANPDEGQSNSSVCVKCKVNFYSGNAGQANCKECSSTSRATSRGSTQCSCIGLNRAFQSSGLCPCEPGYEWYDSTSFQPRTDNGDVDCQPKVYDRCVEEDVRDHTGACTAEKGCSATCGSGGGEVDPTSGLCICDGLQTLAEVCDGKCRSSANTVYYDATLTAFVVVDSSNETLTAVELSDLDGFVGSVYCTSGDCDVLSMTASSGKFEGNYGSGEALTESRRRKRRLLEWSSAPRQRRRLNAGGFEEEYFNETRRQLEDEAYASIESPVVCMDAGSILLFDVSNENYPIYEVDSLINSQPDFDYTGFTTLAETAKSSATVTSFAFTFGEAGLYVFKMSSDSSALTVVKVMEAGAECSTEAAFTPMTESNLNAVKAKVDEDIVLDPDWEVLGGLLGGLSLAIFGIIGAIYHFRKHAWETAAEASKGKYRERARKVNLATQQTRAAPKAVARKGDVVDEEITLSPAATSLSKTSALGVLEDNMLDDLDEEELARQLQRHHDLVEQEFFGQRELVQQLHDAVTHEVDELKRVLATSLADSRGGNSTREALQALKQQVTARRLSDGQAEIAEKEAFRLVEELQRLLAEGSDSMARRIVEEAAQATGLAVTEADEHVVEVAESPTLIRLRGELRTLVTIIEGDLVRGSEAEARRRQIQTTAWRQFVVAHQELALPARITALVARVHEIDDKTDRATNHLATVLASFASRGAHFEAALGDNETKLSRSLAPTFVDTERASALPEQEQVKLQGVAVFTGLLDQLRDALLAVFGTADDAAAAVKRGATSVARANAELVRTELDEAVEDALAAMPRDAALAEISDQLRTVLSKLDARPIDVKPPDVELASAGRDSVLRLEQAAASRVANLPELNEADRQLWRDAVERDKQSAQEALASEQQHQAERVQLALHIPGAEEEPPVKEPPARDEEDIRAEELASELDLTAEALRASNVEAVRAVRRREAAALEAHLENLASTDRVAARCKLSAAREARLEQGEAIEKVAADESAALEAVEAAIRERGEAMRAEVTAHTDDENLEAAHERELRAVERLDPSRVGEMRLIQQSEIEAQQRMLALLDRIDKEEDFGELEMLAAECDEVLVERELEQRRSNNAMRLEALLDDDARRRKAALAAKVAAQSVFGEVDGDAELLELESELKRAEEAARARLDESTAAERGRRHDALRGRLVERRRRALERLDAARAETRKADDKHEHQKLFGTASGEEAAKTHLEAAQAKERAARQVADALVKREAALEDMIAQAEESEIAVLRERASRAVSAPEAINTDASQRESALEERLRQRRDQAEARVSAHAARLKAAELRVQVDDGSRDEIEKAARDLAIAQRMLDGLETQDTKDREDLVKEIQAAQDREAARVEAERALERKVAHEALLAKLEARRRKAKLAMLEKAQMVKRAMRDVEDDDDDEDAKRRLEAAKAEAAEAEENAKGLDDEVTAVSEAIKEDDGRLAVLQCAHDNQERLLAALDKEAGSRAGALQQRLAARKRQAEAHEAIAAAKRQAGDENGCAQEVHAAEAARDAAERAERQLEDVQEEVRSRARELQRDLEKTTAELATALDEEHDESARSLQERLARRQKRLEADVNAKAKDAEHAAERAMVAREEVKKLSEQPENNKGALEAARRTMNARELEAAATAEAASHARLLLQTQLDDDEADRRALAAQLARERESEIARFKHATTVAYSRAQEGLNARLNARRKAKQMEVEAKLRAAEAALRNGADATEALREAEAALGVLDEMDIDDDRDERRVMEELGANTALEAERLRQEMLTEEERKRDKLRGRLEARVERAKRRENTAIDEADAEALRRAREDAEDALANMDEISVVTAEDEDERALADELRRERAMELDRLNARLASDYENRQAHLREKYDARRVAADEEVATTRRAAEQAAEDAARAAQAAKETPSELMEDLAAAAASAAQTASVVAGNAHATKLALDAEADDEERRLADELRRSKDDEMARLDARLEAERLRRQAALRARRALRRKQAEIDVRAAEAAAMRAEGENASEADELVNEAAVKRKGYEAKFLCHDDDDRRSRTDALKAVHARELQALETKLAEKASKSRSELKARLEARRSLKRQGSGMSLLSVQSYPTSEVDAAKEELESKSLLEQQLLAERVAALEALLAGHRRDIETRATPEDAMDRLKLNQAEEQAQAHLEREREVHEAERLEAARRAERDAQFAEADLVIQAKLLDIENEVEEARLKAKDAEREEAIAQTTLHSTMEAARLAALSHAAGDRDDVEAIQADVLAKLKAKHEAQAKALESDLDAERQKRRARLAERRAMRKEMHDITDVDVELAMTGDADELRRAALVVQQQAEKESTEALFARIAELEEEKTMKEAELKAAADREKAARKAAIVAKFTGAARAAELENAQREVEAKLSSDLSKVTASHAHNVEKTVRESEATDAAAEAAAAQLSKIKDDEHTRRGELEATLAKRRESERRKLRERIAARSRASQMEAMTALEKELDEKDAAEIEAEEKNAAERYAAVAEAVVNVRSGDTKDDAGAAQAAAVEADRAREHLEELRLRDAQDADDKAALKLAEDEARRAEHRAVVAAAKAAAIEAKRIAEERAAQAVRHVREEAEQDAKKEAKERDRALMAKKMTALQTDAAADAARDDQRLDSARKEQKSKLQRRIEEKKRKAAERQEKSEKQATRLQEHLTPTPPQKAWAEELRQRAGHIADAEQVVEVIQRGVSEGLVPAEDVGEAVEIVLQRRHAAESAKLLADQYAERSARLTASLNKLLDEKAAARARVLVKGLDEDERQAALEELESDFFVKQKTAQMEIAASLEDQHLGQEAGLRRQHMAQVMDVMRRLDTLNLRTTGSSKATAAQGDEDEATAAADAAELALVHERCEREKEAKLSKIEEERKSAEEEARRDHAAKLAEIQAEQEVAMAREREAANAQLQAERDKLHAEFLANIEEIENEQNLERKKQLMAKFEEERSRAEESINAQQKERRSALKDRLAKRRENKIKQQEAELQAKLKQQEGDANRLKKKVVEQIELTNELHKQKSSKWQLAKQQVFAKLHEEPRQSSYVWQSRRDPTMADFRDKLDQIEALIGKLTAAQARVDQAEVPPKRAETSGELYHDAEDPKPQGSEVVPIPKTNLSPTKCQRLEFAVKLAQCLGLAGKLDLEVAQSLPANCLRGNAFRNSYAYDPETSVLHVHIKRISTYGDVALIVLHAVSHIKTNPHDLSDDTSVTFIAEFYRNFKIVMQELVKMEATSVSLQQQAMLEQQSSSRSATSIERRRPSHDYARDAINDRIRSYADASGYPLLAEFMSRYEADATGQGRAMRKPMDSTSDAVSSTSVAAASTALSTATKAQHEVEQEEEVARAKEHQDLQPRISQRKARN